MVNLGYFEHIHYFLSAHTIWVLIGYAHLSLINSHADIFSGAGVVVFGLSIHLHPYFVKALVSLYSCLNTPYV